MKKGLLTLFILFCLIVISNVIAYQSTITVNAGQPNKEIIFKACDQATGKTLPDGEFRAVADSSGKVVFNYDLEPILIKMSFMAMDGSNPLTFLNGKQVIFIPNVILDEFVDINLNQVGEIVPIAYSSEKEETIENNEESDTEIIETQEEQVNETISEDAIETKENLKEEKDNIVTGSVIGKGKAILLSSTTYYVLGGLLLLVVVVAIVKKKGNKEENYTVKKFSEMKKEPQKSSSIEDAERKLEEAKKELDEIKNNEERANRLKQARERVERDREILRRLESGEQA